MSPRSLIGLLVALVALIGCFAPQPEISARFYVFGTLVDVVLRDVSQARADDAFIEIQQSLQALHQGLHAWEPGPLTELNRAFRAGTSAPVTADIERLLAMSKQVEQVSGGRFNAAAGALVGLWGFHTSHYPVTTPPPSAADLQPLLAARPSVADVTVKDGLASSKNPAVQLDFGGIAKGYAVDLVAAVLGERGISRFIVNAGGDLRAAGGTAERPWRVGIRGPEHVLGGIVINDRAAVFTSGAGQRYLEDDTGRYPHILDPRTGSPVSGLFSATVVTEQGWYADAAATALMVAGPGEWRQVAADLGLEFVLVIEEDGEVLATPAMKSLLAGDAQWIDSIRLVELKSNDAAAD